jgi:hypothetical protein
MEVKMNYIGSLASVLILIFLAFSAVAQDPGNFLDTGDAATNSAASPVVKNATVEDPLNPVQDLKGVATPVIMGKNAPVNPGPSKPKARLLSPSNKWHLDLQDTKDRVVDLELYQSNDAVFGQGIIVVEGKAQNVTATGTVTGNKLALDILTSDLSLFRLALTMSGKSLSGDYHSYSASYVPGQGIAMGKIS